MNRPQKRANGFLKLNWENSKRIRVWLSYAAYIIHDVNIKGLLNYRLTNRYASQRGCNGICKMWNLKQKSNKSVGQWFVCKHVVCIWFKRLNFFMHWRHTSARIWKIEKWRSKIQKPGPIGMHGYHVATNCLQSTASLTKFAQLLKSDCHFSYEIFVNRLRLYFHEEVVYKSPFFSLGIFCAWALDLWW